jgi:uncharacterized protein (TIGR02266 family)
VVSPADPSDEAKRRRHDRAGVVLQLQYRNAGHLLVSYCTNLSRGGVFVPSDEPLPPGTQIDLQLHIPGEPTPVELGAEVRWVRLFDATEGPAGMGLAFDGIDGILGARIDGVVSRFSPLRVELVGQPSQAFRHVDALVRSLVVSETHERTADPAIVAAIEGADLVVVDLDSTPEEGLAVLTGLRELERPPPAIALCAEREVQRRARAARVARVVLTPVDSAEMRTCVLETVAQVHARRSDLRRR